MFSDPERQILSMLEIEDFPPEEQREILDRVMTTILRAVTLRALLVLPKDMHDEINALLKNEEDPTFTAFQYFDKHIADFENVVREEALSVFERLTLAQV